MYKFSRGFTLLEMLVVLAIIGLGMAFTMDLKQKKVEEIKQRQTAKLITGEIRGLIDFIQQGKISVIENGKGNHLKTNPLYDLTLTGARKDIYSKRVTNYKFADPLQTAKFFEWHSSVSQRSYFTSNSCGPESLNTPYHFEKEYLPCAYPSQLKNDVLNIVRVDVVGDPSRLDIDRVDFIISYTPLTQKAEDKLKFDSYLQAFNQAFESMGLSYSHAHILVRPLGSSTNSAWTLLMTGSGSKREPVNFGDMSRYITSAESHLQQQFGIRFSVSTKNEHTGKNGADKLCWDGTKSKSTLCLSSADGQGYNHSDNQLLVLQAENPDGTKTVGTLLSNVILESPGRYTHSKPELTTIPLISYAAFGNSMNTDVPPLAGARYDQDYMGPLLEEGGRITLPVQRCPLGPNNRQLYPRIAAAISSVSSDVSYDLKQNVATHLRDYSNPALTRSVAPSSISSDFSKVEIQVNRYGKIWVVTSTVAAYNRAYEKTFSYRNPSSVSVVITRWCSTIEVDYSRSYFRNPFGQPN
ncbi:prepilin-type N-terminal cleavage/methylation domain-containing protein [Ewingella allii]|uniref:type II secretion system protein n=1 Tax=Ewingella allii TaxID=3092550 RepID=UPI0037B0E2AB